MNYKPIFASYQFHIPKNLKNNKTIKKVIEFETRKVTKFTKLFDTLKSDATEDIQLLKDLSKELSYCHDSVVNDFKNKHDDTPFNSFYHYNTDETNNQSDFNNEDKNEDNKNNDEPSDEPSIEVVIESHDDFFEK